MVHYGQYGQYMVNIWYLVDIISEILMEPTKLNKVCKMEQYLNYILMIKNQNILATLMLFLSQLKI